MIDRALVKGALVALLDELAEEHPAGHQAAYAGRYVLETGDGTRLEIMVEKGERSPPNVWVLEKAAAALRQQGIKSKPSPKSKLHAGAGKNGKPAYGRHSALQKLEQLANEDLLCLAPENLAQVGSIIDQLLGVKAADLA